MTKKVGYEYMKNGDEVDVIAPHSSVSHSCEVRVG